MLKTLLHEQQEALNAIYEKKKINNIPVDKMRIARSMYDKLTEIGFKKVDVKEKDLEEKNGVGKMTNIATIKIDPKETGPLAPVFSEIEVQISVGYSSDSDVGQITLQYSWDHPSGSNGYRMSYVLRDGEWEVMA